ncbi:hypothetical protein GCM10010214_00770 [Streptomyces abikoensis]|nr:hypothetical protein GCM10010214_00770 [Streptomyces abikoensis]
MVRAAPRAMTPSRFLMVQAMAFSTPRPSRAAVPAMAPSLSPGYGNRMSRVRRAARHIPGDRYVPRQGGSGPLAGANRP